MSTRRLAAQPTSAGAEPRPSAPADPCLSLPGDELHSSFPEAPRLSLPGDQPRPSLPGGRRKRVGGLRRLGALDPLEAVALVARERRELLLATYGQRLGREELEDCYSQATLELLMRARRPGSFACTEHIANALEQRLCSRIQDRHRALGGRSPIEAAMARALPIAVCGERSRGSVRGLVDERADVERIALLREELERIARFSRELTRDQRLLLAGQLSGQTPGGFCAEHGWSLEKYRKVGQRARAHLNRLLAADSAVPAAPPVSLTAPIRVAPAVPVAGHGRISTQGPAYEIHSPTT